MMIRIALCDDEVNILDEVSARIGQYAQKHHIQDIETFCFATVKSLKNALDDGNAFDMFILDVYIGNELGTELAGAIRKRGIESPIIFLTTSLEHAPQSFETGTLRYLLKPLEQKKLYEAMDAALIQVEKMRERFIKFKTENGVESVNARNILYSEAHDHHQFITLNDGRHLKVRMTVTELFTKISQFGGFIRIGSAYIINLRHVKNVSSTVVCLYNNFHIQVPRGKYTEIKNAFWNFQYEGQED